MKSENLELSLKNKFEALYEKNKEILFKNDTPVLANIREKAFDHFRSLGFPDQSLEDWRNTNLSDALTKPYHMYFEPTYDKNIDLEHIFKCEIPHFNTKKLPQLNGWYISKGIPLDELPDGVIYGSLAEAIHKYPDLIEKYYSKYADTSKNGFDALNTAFAQDGVFIYVPDNVKIKKPVQMVSIINLDENIFVHIRNLIILGKNSSLTLVHCDDSIDQRISFTNSLTEIHVGENAQIDHYKLQNKNNKSTLINTIYFNQENNSRVTSNAITLNGGIIRNDTHVCLNGEGSESNIYGIYLVDKDQHVDNQVYIDHAKPNTYSNELFKGILDDYASAVFNGHVLVRRNAQKINAFQNNKNILLTDKAKINTKPFLEIYADDVKCSHGATVGQLDDDAMFYIRSRGISEENARLLLMYAFAAEVINKISIDALRNRIDDMVKKRLRGELSICDQCVLHCSQKEKPVVFEIDMSKI
ncbi:Fe-S cluster assembly protein SufD [Bacteroidota bacterium]